MSSGTAADLSSNSTVSGAPTGASLLGAFESPAGNASNFGQRIRGIISPPLTGAYTFYIAGDAPAQLYLSNDTNPANEQIIASVAAPTAAEKWTQSAAQRSVSIILNAGSSYFIEALSKVSTGTGDIGVAWSLPNGTFNGPISGQYLAPIVPTVQIWDTQPIAARGDNVPAIFTVTRSGGSTALPVTVSYALGGTAVNGVDYKSLGGTVTIPAGAQSAAINVLGIDDKLSHSTKTITLTLTAGASYNLAAPSDVTTSGTILGSNPAVNSGTQLEPANAATLLKVLGSTTNSKTSVMSVSAMPFTSAVDLQTTTSTNAGTLFPFTVPTSGAIAKGDVLFFQFYAKSLNADGSAIEFTSKVEQSASPNSYLTTYLNSAGAYWRKYVVPISANASYAAGAARLDFRLNNDTQSMEVGGVSLVDLHKTVGVSSLPTTPAVYDNNYNDAWRAAAQASIDQIRQGNLTINVTDASGKPIPGAVVSVQQVRQAFNFGAAVNGHYLTTTDDPEYNNVYRGLVQNLLNTATSEYNLKWPFWATQRQVAIDNANWITNAGLTLRGHNLVWPNFQYLPPEVQTTYQAMLNNPKQGKAAAAAWLEQTIIAHITDEVGTLKGLPAEWDTLVEPYANHEVTDIVGKANVVNWFKAAHAADPNARLYVNDYGIIGTDTSHQSNYYQWIQYLLNNGAPLGGIGEESHFAALPPTIKQVQSFFSQFGQFHIPIDITEFDVNTGNQQLLADFARDYMTEAFSQPLATDFIAWDFWAGTAVRPNSALVGKNYQLTPFGQVWVDQIFGQWSTNAQGTTFASGQYSTRAYTGTLNVTVTLGNQTKTVQVSLSTAGTSVTIALANSASTTPNLTATVAAAGVKLAWKPWAANAAHYVVQRSDDNVRFAPLATVASNATGFFDVTAWPTLTEYYRVIAVDVGGNPISTASARSTPAVLAPANFFYISGSIGASPLGSASFNNGVYTLAGGGADIGGASDHFSCDFDDMLGDGTIITHLSSLQSNTANAKAGLMLRGDNSVTSAFIDVVTTPGHGILLQYRTAAGGQAVTVALNNTVAMPWLKLTRAANSFTAWASADGVTWTQVGSAITLAMPMAPLAGLIVSSGVAGKSSTATFDEFSETPGTVRLHA
jgi:GH35 family endo-1,4-beta-xylanase